MKYLTLILICILITSFSFGQNNDPTLNPIDHALDLCIEKDPSTAGMIGCTYEAELQWDSLMNKYYKLLIDGNETVEGKKLIENSQINWNKFRNAELELYKKLFDLDGTMWPVVRAGESMNLVKSRAIQLKEYYETLNQH